VALREQIGNRATWAAVSTFEGEDEIAAAVHRALKPRHKALTILVPRHPDRADAIETMLKANGLKVARRSRSNPSAPTPISILAIRSARWDSIST
jgi:3-deoxy-D-manno-octulosonic-acid transferase